MICLAVLPSMTKKVKTIQQYHLAKNNIHVIHNIVIIH